MTLLFLVTNNSNALFSGLIIRLDLRLLVGFFFNSHASPLPNGLVSFVQEKATHARTHARTHTRTHTQRSPERWWWVFVVFSGSLWASHQHAWSRETSRVFLLFLVTPKRNANTIKNVKSNKLWFSEDNVSEVTFNSGNFVTHYFMVSLKSSTLTSLKVTFLFNWGSSTIFCKLAATEKTKNIQLCSE